MFLLVPAYPGCPGSKAVKRSLLLLSVTIRCSIETDGRNNLVFSVAASFDQSYNALQGNSGIYKNKGTSLWNYFFSKLCTSKILVRHIDF